MPRKKKYSPKNPAQENRLVEIHSEKLQLRAAGEGTPGTIVGYAAVFESPSEIYPGTTEVIAVGAFAESLSRGDDVRAFAQHDKAAILGRRSAETLRIEEDDTGLRVEIDLPDTTVAHDLAENLRLGNLDGMSFGFLPKQVEWTFTDSEDEPDIRRLLEVDLIEVSVVTFAAYDSTTAALRCAEAVQAEADQIAKEAADHRSQRPACTERPASPQTLRLRAAARDAERRHHFRHASAQYR